MYAEGQILKSLQSSTDDSRAVACSTCDSQIGINAYAEHVQVFKWMVALQPPNAGLQSVGLESVLSSVLLALNDEQGIRRVLVQTEKCGEAKALLVRLADSFYCESIVDDT